MDQVTQGGHGLLDAGISPALADGLDPGKLQAVEATEGPVLIIAGPGAGKTLTLIHRTLHILEQGLAEPSEIILCTFTEKAALELRDRLASTAGKIGLKTDLTSLQVGTIHGISNRLVDLHRHDTDLGNGYEVLDDLTGRLFLFENFDAIAGEPWDDGKFLGRWVSKWKAIEGLRSYFDKITEELVDPAALATNDDLSLAAIGEAYQRYEALLLETNRVDFGHIQKTLVNLLDNDATRESITQGIRYVMVDEYQDTNFIQERLLLGLASGTGNICVVGDEDQSIYRFRNSTVRNILEFPFNNSGTQEIPLTTNYRSHEQIIRAYDSFMGSADWSNPDGEDFRFDKTILPPSGAKFADYPAVFGIWGESKAAEGERFASLVEFLKEQGVVKDYNQVALLLYSVKSDHSGPYIDALAARGIPAFCPRARLYFENEEVAAMCASLALILGWHGDARGNIQGHALSGLASYIDESIIGLRQYVSPHPLGELLRDLESEVSSLDDKVKTLDLRLADVFYRLLSVQPFSGWLKDENRAYNLARLSTLINEFQRYYHFGVFTQKNIQALRFSFFNSFLRLLHVNGLNEREDGDRPFPSGYVQIMTIHQAKGLEFPVVVVGSLDYNQKTQKKVDRELSPYYQRDPFEPEDRITTFDRMRLFYVAFSRAEKVLVLTTSSTPKTHFSAIWDGLDQWPHVEEGLLAAQDFEVKDREPPKKSYSFTGDLRVFETCPRQYEMYRHYDFTPSRSAVIFFGLLVHQTIEDVHRLVLAGRSSEVDDHRIEQLFEFNFRHLSGKDVKPIGDDAKASALGHVFNYVHSNWEQMPRVMETEVDVSLEKDEFILTGAIDLIRGDDDSLELLDFKAQKRPPDGDPSLEAYYQQLCIYAHIVQQRRGRRPDRLLLYWTGEPTREDALMEFDYVPGDVAEAVAHFSDIVRKVQREEFAVEAPPGSDICKECDFRPVCVTDGTIGGEGK